MTHRNFGMSSGPASLGAQRLQARSPHSAILSADLSNVISLAGRNSSLRDRPNSEVSKPLLFVPTIDTALPRGDFAQALIDVAAVFAWFLLCSVTGVGIAVAIFILLFVRV